MTKINWGDEEENTLGFVYTGVRYRYYTQNKYNPYELASSTYLLSVWTWK